ncbi:MAG: hypothetical protein IKC79_00315, partial [Clostridia bacterium]|nr:hypothetical protein [Clostridia bacterium]
HLGVTQTAYFFDKSAGNIDPVELKANGTSATNLISNVNSATKSEFPVNSYIDNLDTYMLVLDFAVTSSPGVNFSSNFSLNIAFMADVQYDMDNEHLLTVSQPINQTSPAWTKVGYNANLTAQATKLETNSLTTLKNAYDNRDEYGNTSNTHIIDDYVNAVVYRDIDIVNIDIATGEVIGKLSDVNYDFEWYGGAVTLPSGTTLASGRVLSKSETFTVDCYTYYPTMYLRRWMVGDTQYITLSDQFFPGSTKIDAYYTATFESTIFNPDYSVATNSLGNIIPRSYSYWWTPLTNGSAAHLQTYYNFGTLSGSTASTTQTQYLAWTNNLTTTWQNYIFANPSMSSYITAQGVQGENYHAFVYKLLYLVKYADNNSQEMIGYGNSYTYNLYHASGITIETPNGTITTGGGDNLSRYSSERGGGVIGLKGTKNNSAGEGINYNNAGMCYGYAYSTPMYSQEFLTYFSSSKSILLDGYIGSDKFTSVWCMGICNSWGNLWKWIFGTASLYDESSDLIYAYINFEEYDASTENYITDNSTDSWVNQNNYILSKNYSRLTYTLPKSSNWFRYAGVSNVSSRKGIQSLIGLPSSASTTTVKEITGLTDYYWASTAGSATYGILHSGYSKEEASDGIYTFNVSGTLNVTYGFIGFRSMLIN